MQKREFAIETRQGRTFVMESGPAHAPAVVLPHGMGANSAVWLPDIALWSSTFRLLAIDVIGEPGLSSPSRPTSGSEHAQWLDDVFDGLGLQSLAIVGTSFGGWLALNYTTRRPEKIRALALICPAGIGRQRSMMRFVPYLLLGSWGKLKLRRKVLGPMPEDMSADLTAMAGFMSLVGRATNPRLLRLPQFTDEELRQLPMPILGVVGGHDILLDSHETRERLARNTPTAEVCFIDQGYHFLPKQAPRVMDFLQRHLLAIKPG